jgi:hypothetical protein
MRSQQPHGEAICPSEAVSGARRQRTAAEAVLDSP